MDRAKEGKKDTQKKVGGATLLGATVRGKWHSEAEKVPGDFWEVHSVTGSRIQGVLSEVPGWPLRDPLTDPLRDPKTSQNLSGLLPYAFAP